MQLLEAIGSELLDIIRYHYITYYVRIRVTRYQDLCSYISESRKLKASILL